MCPGMEERKRLVMEEDVGWERQSVLGTKTWFSLKKTDRFRLPESLRDEDDLIFFLGEDKEGEGLSCLDLLPFDANFCKWMKTVTSRCSIFLGNGER